MPGAMFFVFNPELGIFDELYLQSRQQGKGVEFGGCAGGRGMGGGGQCLMTGSSMCDFIALVQYSRFSAPNTVEDMTGHCLKTK